MSTISCAVESRTPMELFDVGLSLARGFLAATAGGASPRVRCSLVAADGLENRARRLWGA